MPSLAAKGSAAPAGVMPRAQDGTNQGFCGAQGQQAGPSQGTCDRLRAWICSCSSRGSVLPGLSWPGHGRWGRWSELSQVSSQTPAMPNHPVFESGRKRCPHFPSICTCSKGGSLICVQRGSTSAGQLWSQGLSWMANKGQAGCPSLHRWGHLANMGRQLTCTLFCFCSLYLTQAFIFRDIRRREIAKLLVRSLSLMTHQVLQSQNRLLVLERYKTCQFYGYCTKHCIYACKGTF